MTWSALSLLIACGGNASGGGACPDSGPCAGSGGTGNTGNSGGFGNAGNTGGVGNTGNTGGVGNTGNTGGVGNTGNTGGVGNTGNTGGVGNTGNTGGVGNTGGFGNTGGSGGTGGVANCPPLPSGGMACSSSPCSCGSSTCSSYNVGGIIEMKPCCPPPGACGTYVDSTVATLIGSPVGCYAHNQPGNLNTSCPPFEFDNPLQPGTKSQFLGCCRPTGTCGYLIDISSESGPNFGCVAANCSGGPTTCTP